MRLGVQLGAVTRGPMLRTWILMLVTAAVVPGRATATEPVFRAGATHFDLAGHVDKWLAS